MNIGYHIAIQRGRLVRAAYSKLLPILAKRPIKQDIQLPVSVYSFSCQRDLPEQVASIRSFIKNVGVPQKFVVVSDGTYKSNGIQILCSIHPSVAVANYQDFISPSLPQCVTDFALSNIMGKKLAVELSLEVSQATIFADSDVLFFRGASVLRDYITTDSCQAWYLPDVNPALDKRLLRHITESKHPVNAGFMLLKKPLDWKLSIQRLSELTEAPIGNTEQTSVHFAMHCVGAQPLRQGEFVLKLDDQVHFTDWYAHKDIALRHYVNPVRHKMWSRFSY